MKALVYHGPGQKAWETVPDPMVIDPTDAIVQIDTTTICGTDLHILKGDVPAVTEGRILGHEGVGTVIEVGAAVTTVAIGDRVIISCVSACGSCSYCHQGLYAHCLADEGASGLGWILGHLDLLAGDFVAATIDGVQQRLCQVDPGAEELHLLADPHRGDTAGDGRASPRLAPDQIVGLVLNGGGVDGHLCTQLLNPVGSRPFHITVRFGSGAGPRL